MTTTPLTFAIVGCGRIAQRHAEHIQRVGRLVAVCDAKLDRADDLGNRTNAQPYSSIESLLSSVPTVDVVSICTPNALHAEQSILALSSGHHVICEKPMALSSVDCRRMIEVAEKAKKQLFIVKQNRFNPPVAAVKQALDEGRLGRILSVQVNCFWNREDRYYTESDWKGRKALDGGTLYTQFSHFIDLLLWMVGDVRSLNASTKNFIHGRTVEFEDTGVVMLEFESGALGTINYTVNAFKSNMEGSITLFCENGTVKVGGQYLNELEYQSIRDFRITGLPAGAPANQYGFYQGSMSNHDKVYANVVDVLVNKGAAAATGIDGLKTVDLIERIYALVR